MPRIIDLPTFTDERASLTVYDPGILNDPAIDLPFIPKRIFWIWGVSKGKERANHAHEICEQIIIPLAGVFEIEIDDGDRYCLKHHTGLYVEAGHKIRLYNFRGGAICLVLCSEHYDAREAIRFLLSEMVDLLEADNNMEREVKLEILNKIDLIGKLLISLEVASDSQKGD